MGDPTLGSNLNSFAAFLSRFLTSLNREGFQQSGPIGNTLDFDDAHLGSDPVFSNDLPREIVDDLIILDFLDDFISPF